MQATGDYLVVHEKAMVGRYDKLAGARAKLLEYTGDGNNRMVVPVTELWLRFNMGKWRWKTRSSVSRTWQVRSSISARAKVSNGAVKSGPDTFNKNKYLNWWWAGHDALNSMVDVAKTYLVELNTRGSLALLCLWLPGVCRTVAEVQL